MNLKIRKKIKKKEEKIKKVKIVKNWTEKLKIIIIYPFRRLPKPGGSFTNR